MKLTTIDTTYSPPSGDETYYLFYNEDVTGETFVQCFIRWV